MIQPYRVPIRQAARRPFLRSGTSGLLLVVLISTFAAQASAGSLMLVRPGQTNRPQLHALFGAPALELEHSSGKADLHEAQDRGYAQLAAWYGPGDTLDFLRAKMVAELTLDEASLLFLLSDPPRVEVGNPFATQDDRAGLTQHHDRDGVHFYVRDEVVREIWITREELDAATLRLASGVFDRSADTSRAVTDPDSPRGWFGCALGTLDPDIAGELGAPPDGVLVLGVARHSPAHRAGLLPEDVIAELDGSTIPSGEEWSARMAEKRPGDVLVLMFWRRGSLRSAVVTLEPRPVELPPLLEHGQVWLGIGLQSVDAEVQRTRSLPVDVGVLVRSLAPEGPAESAGLREGDVITAARGLPVKRTEEILDLVASGEPGDSLELAVVRGRARLSLAARLEAVPEANLGLPSEVDTLPGWGLRLRELNAATAAEVRVPLRHGFFVADVQPGGPAELAGLRAGDVITHAQGRCVGKLGALERLSTGSRLRVVAQHRGRPFVTVIHARRGR